MAVRCITCKGRGLCGRPVCPLLIKLEELAALPRIGNRLSGESPPEVFVGRHGYPVVRAGPLVPVGASPEQPALDIFRIISLRTRMVRSELEIHVDDAKNPGRLLESAQHIAMSSRPVETEVSFVRPPEGRMLFDGVLSPMGPGGRIEDMDITGNPSVPRKVDRIVGDTDVKAASAVYELYSSSISVDHISRLLSIGLLGRDRRLVPTRWAITASDDIIGNALRSRVIDMPEMVGYELYSGGILGNHFEIILMPGAYSFELIEIWHPGSAWSPERLWIGSDSEGITGRRSYSPLAGGYYAARLPVLEHLLRIKRQAGVLALREITEEYWAPLGVWVVRDAARAALSSRPMRFESLDEAIRSAESRMRTKSSEWKRYSNAFSRQTTLASFFPA
ncbi:MAG TPA: Nre family DNA repair protein [Methanothrix sp.]|nr:Nre family DNA repair protein [Methanothrix sp.]HOK57875.1 Nre family DNA repair protein [Methanothrix sp.]HOL43278.1 Nre family DNA repair protein [Methanothrix sp.]HPO88190.1 Nre family DNA repair protein [Methanothrix sp.]